MEPVLVRVFFVDMDGTLADSMPVLYRVYCDFLNELGVKADEEGFRELIGPSLGEIVAILKRKYGWQESEQELLRRYQDKLHDYYVRDIEVFPGAVECLQYLKRKGMRIWLVTSAVEPLARGFVERNGMQNLFDGLIVPDETTRGKPAPDLYSKALRTAKYGSHQAVAIEDSVSGCQAAEGAGVHTLIIHDGNWAKIRKTLECWYE